MSSGDSLKPCFKIRKALIDSPAVLCGFPITAASATAGWLTRALSTSAVPIPADDVNKVAGNRIGTAEGESALVSHPAVAEAAVIGKPHKTAGESIKAFLILKQGFKESPELIQQMKDHVKHELGKIAVPQEVEIVPSLPKTRSGKIMRRVLKAKELGQNPGDISTLED